MGYPVQGVRDAIDLCDHAPEGCPVAIMMSGTSEALSRGLVIQVREACLAARDVADYCRPSACPARPTITALEQSLRATGYPA